LSCGWPMRYTKAGRSLSCTAVSAGTAASMF
jgi:hypothetical protein